MTTFAKEAAAIIKKRTNNFTPKIGMILGSGLGVISSQIENAIKIPYEELPCFSVSSVAGHAKMMHVGILKGVPVVCLEGRSHTYEGGNCMEVLKTIIRTLKLLGCEMILTTNAVGSLREEMGTGSLMVVEDQINFMFSNPLIGKNDDEFGDRFVSMENAYDSELRSKMLAIAKKRNITLYKGVYIATSGPTFESPAEIRAYRTMGADATGMSTVPETIIARHCGLKVITVCAITNLAAGLNPETLSHEQTLRGAKMAVDNLAKLFLAFLEEGVK
jgi:xanthosine phosphorylase